MSSPDDVVGVENVSGSLADAIDAAASELSVQPGGGTFPAGGFQVKIDNEVILVGTRSGNDFSSLTRGQEGTVAVPHAPNTKVELVVGGEAITQELLPSWWQTDPTHDFVLAGGTLAIGAIADYAASLGSILALSVTEDVADGSSQTINIPGFGSSDIGPVGGLIVTQGSPGKQPGALQMAGTVLYLQMPDAETFNAEQSLPPVTVFGYKNNGVGDNPIVDVIQVWKDYATGLAWGIGYGGQEWLQAADVPVDSVVANGQRWQWYDDTNGAPKLLIKERDAAGTLYSRISATLIADASAFAGISKPTVPTSPTAAQVAAALSTLGLVTLT